MRSRIIVGSVLLLGVLAAGTIATSGDGVAPPPQWAIANFTDPVLVTDQILMGPYLIVHDDAKMERGEPCTSFYRFDPVKGPQEEVVSFHCTPADRKLADKLTLTQSETDSEPRHRAADGIPVRRRLRRARHSDQAVRHERRHDDDCPCRRDRRGRPAHSS